MILGIATVVFVFVTPYNRMPGVRLGGHQPRMIGQSVNNEILMQLKTGGFPPFVVNIWYVGTEEGVIFSIVKSAGA